MSATTTLEKPAGLPALATLTQDDFVKHMHGMREHYTVGAARPKQVYAMPVSLINPVLVASGARASASGKTAVDTALNQGKASTEQFARNQETAVNGAKSKLAQNHDTDAFAKQMEQLEQQAQQQAHDNIHKQFQSLIDIGKAHPEQQHRILTLANQIGAFFTNLIASVGAFFKKVVAEIIGWIKSAVDWIKGAAATVAHWVEGAVASIGHFFSSLF